MEDQPGRAEVLGGQVARIWEGKILVRSYRIRSLYTRFTIMIMISLIAIVVPGMVQAQIPAAGAISFDKEAYSAILIDG
jgi:hypothetical protein